MTQMEREAAGQVAREMLELERREDVVRRQFRLCALLFSGFVVAQLATLALAWLGGR